MRSLPYLIPALCSSVSASPRIEVVCHRSSPLRDLIEQFAPPRRKADMDADLAAFKQDIVTCLYALGRELGVLR